MAKDHFIPAALLGRFSEEQSGPTRDRKLQVISRHTAPRTARASAIGYKNGLYDVDKDFFSKDHGRAIDNLWDTYEPKLPAALDALIDGTLTASDWVRVIVPFVAATFSRDRTYAERIEERLLQQGVEDPRANLPWVFDKTHVNMNRLIEMNRFAARAITSNWYVYEADGDLVIPDLGFGINLIGDFEGKDVVGLILPVGRRHVLELVPVPDRETAYRTAGGDWKVPIVRGPSAGTSLELNKCLAQCAQDFMAGTEAAVAMVSSDDMAKFEPAAIDSILNQWPFNLDTRVLAGIHAPLERLLHNETLDLDQWILDPFEGVVGLDPAIDFQFARFAPSVPASCFLARSDTAICVRAHDPMTKQP